MRAGSHRPIRVAVGANPELSLKTSHLPTLKRVCVNCQSPGPVWPPQPGQPNSRLRQKSMYGHNYFHDNPEILSILKSKCTTQLRWWKAMEHGAIMRKIRKMLFYLDRFLIIFWFHLILNLLSIEFVKGRSTEIDYPLKCSRVPARVKPFLLCLLMLPWSI